MPQTRWAIDGEAFSKILERWRAKRSKRGQPPISDAEFVSDVHISRGKWLQIKKAATEGRPHAVNLHTANLFRDYLAATLPELRLEHFVLHDGCSLPASVDDSNASGINHPRFQMFGVSLSDMTLERSFLRRAEPGLPAEAIRCENFLGGSKASGAPRWLAELRTRVTCETKAKAERDGFQFNNNRSYALADVVPDRQVKSGERQPLVRLRLKPTTYYQFFLNTQLDKRTVIDGVETTPREKLGLPREGLRFETLKDFPYLSCRIGTGTVVVTADNRIVVPVRSVKLAIAGQETGTHSYHLSVAEGMFAQDVDAAVCKFFGRPPTEASSRTPSVIATAIRGLEDELGLIAGQHYNPRHLRCLGMLFDVKRLQPYFVFYIETAAHVKFSTVQDCWLHASDKPEAIDLLGLPWNNRTARRLVLADRITYQDKPLPIASNHALAGYMLAAMRLRQLEQLEQVE